MNQSLFPSDKIFSVSEINSILKEIIEGTFPTLTIEGEISNYRPNSSGHLYFKLKDSSSQLNAVMFKSSAFYLQFKPKDGDKVRVHGKLTVYAPNGNYQILVTKMEKAGTGDILTLLEERKRRLFEEGLFDSAKKKPLPKFPKTIGVVTSPTGAAIRDILQITKRRNPSVSILILPSLVQGENASLSISRQIKNANDFSLCDVLIVGRGGGSLEDLLPFSEEEVVRSIAESKIPVVSALGHEIDWALCDYASDVRAPTPSAAAEIVVPEKNQIVQTLQNAKSALKDSVSARIEHLKLLIKQFAPENFEHRIRTIELPFLNRLDNAKTALLSNIEEKILDTKRTVQTCVAVLETANPENILSKGYSMVTIKSSGKILKQKDEVSKGEEVEIRLSKGYVEAVIK